MSIGRFFNLYVLVFAGVVFIPCTLVWAQTALVCTNLTSDLSAGMTDTSQNGPVLELQNFLLSEGLLTAAPNGHFGPATLAATIVFQSANGIPATGYVGPLTRAAIENKSCETAGAATGVSAQSASPSVSVPAVTQAPSITAPAANESVPLGSNYTIKWNGNPGYNYTIVLEDQYGIGKGIIASNLSTGNQYVWQAGRVISSGGTGYSFITTGTYRIHIETNSNQDMYSGLFSVSAPPISITSIMPSSAPADGDSAVVIFGSGFINSTTLSLDGYYSVNTLFISTDGRVAVFSIPANIPPGSHNVIVRNQYGSYSNSVPINVTAPTTN